MNDNAAGQLMDKDATNSEWLRFVVREHDTTRLHNDFRLEWAGVLISWFLVEGPSLNPNITHSATKVVDHSLYSLKHDGRIPKGRYGAGPFKRWDNGDYRVIGETNLLLALESGCFVIEMRGNFLKGKFQFVREGDTDKWAITKMWDESVDENWQHVFMTAEQASRFGRKPRRVDLERAGQIRLFG